MKPEEEARRGIDDLLTEAGWAVQDYKQLNVGASKGVAVREFPLKSGSADYLLFVDRRAIGAIEAKPKGTTLGGVSEQTEKYLWGVPNSIPQYNQPLPFGYESTSIETHFRDMRDPDSRCARKIYSKVERLLEEKV